MSLSTLLLAILLILWGLTMLAVISVSSTILGAIALVAGIAFLVEGYHPITVYKRP